MRKLLVSDFDNTLLNNDDFLKNIKIINEFVKQGNIFVIATGRHINSLLNLIKTYDIKYSYLINNDGGIIFDHNLNIIYQKNIPKKTAQKIIEIFQNSNCLIDWYVDTGLGITKDVNNNVNGLIGRFNNLKEAEVLFKNIVTLHNDIHGYLTLKHINITEKTVTKGNAIKILNKKLNLKEDNIYTIGDTINDISMSIFNSYCMTNSLPDLKKICKGEYQSVYNFVKDILNNKI
ncbi:MAG: HAD family hydrolase [Bacilli bacterium]|jgi:HAD superfamily hydrolase (TIGR01484 family)